MKLVDKPIRTGILDSVDVKILRMLMMGGSSFLGNDVRRPYRMIAGRLNMTEDTVRNRLERFRQEDFIRGWKLGINPTPFGRQASFLLLDVRPPSSKEDVIRKISLIDGILFILSYFGNFLGVQLTYEDGQAFRKKRELIVRIANSENLISMKTSFPNCTTHLTHTDWGLIRALRANPRRSFIIVAKELGISSRTARRRTERMVKGGAIYTLPDINIKALRGVVEASLSVFYSNPEFAQRVAAKIISQFDEYLVLFHATDREHGWFGFLLPNISKANETEKWVKDLEGVQSTSMRLGEDFINLIDEAFGVELRKNIATTIPPVRATSP